MTVLACIQLIIPCTSDSSAHTRSNLMYNVYMLDVYGQKDEPMRAQRCGKETARTETDNRMVGNPADNAGESMRGC